MCTRGIIKILSSKIENYRDDTTFKTELEAGTIFWDPPLIFVEEEEISIPEMKDVDCE